MRVMILLVLGICTAAYGCREKSTTDDVPAVDPPHDSGPPTSASCMLADGACGPREACCPDLSQVIGYRADLERQCHSDKREILACRTQTDAGGCGTDDAYGCLKRTLPDGGVEVFFTNHDWRVLDPPGYSECEPEVYDRVLHDRFCE